MSLAVERVLVVGGGIAGMAAAIHLRRHGARPEVIDADSHWRVYGAGITITGPTLRAYRRLGLLDRIRAEGAVTNGTRLLHFSGAQIAELDEPVLEDGLPATGGILRPVLHKIMSDEVRALDIPVRLGVSVTSVDQDSEGPVRVAFSDGSRSSYDLVLCGDGIYSPTRALVFPAPAPPTYTGQVSWRVLAPRPAGMDRSEFYLGHHIMAGVVPCSPEQVYVFVLSSDPERSRIAPSQQPVRLRELLAGFGGHLAVIRDSMGPDTSVVYRPLESALQPRPWREGRVLLIGDAAHATTPHLASGAGLAVEDALVLVEELARQTATVETALDAFETRRYERCAFVVRAGLEIGEVQIAEGASQKVGKLSSAAMHVLIGDI